ncbi:hypothetical protein TNIN_100761 [Trichonephila inaurata madagascariensis]|uniref:Uncharacterized protein n=1 Tax=Trichonephila inaurata madagascariensis TaxID=2747483 RepID=A0A8X6XVR6_9ARAC|nr:hypothetical protein TNIN_100761 [Trichonephila inaurata madagascariensis]
MSFAKQTRNQITIRHYRNDSLSKTKTKSSTRVRPARDRSGGGAGNSPPGSLQGSVASNPFHRRGAPKTKGLQRDGSTGAMGGPALGRGAAAPQGSRGSWLMASEIYGEKRNPTSPLPRPKPRGPQQQRGHHIPKVQRGKHGQLRGQRRK